MIWCAKVVKHPEPFKKAKTVLLIVVKLTKCWSQVLGSQENVLHWKEVLDLWKSSSEQELFPRQSL